MEQESSQQASGYVLWLGRESASWWQTYYDLNAATNTASLSYKHIKVFTFRFSELSHVGSSCCVIFLFLSFLAS